MEENTRLVNSKKGKGNVPRRNLLFFYFGNIREGGEGGRLGKDDIQGKGLLIMQSK